MSAELFVAELNTHDSKLKTMALMLYHVDWCPECEEVRHKLDEAGLAYESIIVPDVRPFRKQVFEVSGQYYVPVLKDGARVLTETDEILAYIASKAEGNRLAQR